MPVKSLIIVESPTKSRTLSRFLGDEYQILATMGHIRDLPGNKLAVDVEYDFKPEYAWVDQKKAAVAELKKAFGKTNQVFLATDPDREGEAIAWHVIALLREAKKAKLKTRVARITFHEITRSAIQRALKKPGKINMRLVNAQQARRVLDRLVGYKLSPLLWRKIRIGLSAGRVQSVTVRLIVEREREIKKFKPEEYWEIWAELKGKPKTAFLAKLVKVNDKRTVVKNKAQSQKAGSELRKANWLVERIEKKQVLRNPSPPFTTSTMQQRAVQALGFSSRKTMRVAQTLYERGLITYHRTDSLSLAGQAVSQIRKYIGNAYGQKYLPEQPRFYKTRSKVAQEAHEAIRPTGFRPNKRIAALQRDGKRLYQLIFNRAVASQMTAAVWDQTKIYALADQKYQFLVEGRVIKFNGWLAVYEGDKKKAISDKDKELPELTEGEKLKLINLDCQQKFTQPSARYSEATLIKALEQRGIGRPSTYAPTVFTIQNRQYVEKNEGRFQPTLLGITVNDFLLKHFPDVFDYDFTAEMEDKLDDIARGERQWQSVVGDFYRPFAKVLHRVAKESKRVKVPVEKTGKRCPQCKQGELVIRVGRFGKFISCSRFPKCKHTAPYAEELKGIKCPQCGGKVVIKKTRKRRRFFGCSNYPECKWASWRDPRKAPAGKK